MQDEMERCVFIFLALYPGGIKHDSPMQKEPCSDKVGKTEQRGIVGRLRETYFEELWMSKLECMLNNSKTTLLTNLHAYHSVIYKKTLYCILC